jgi:hypothetical protein
MDDKTKDALCKQIYLLSLDASDGKTREDKRHRALARLQMFLSDLNDRRMLSQEDMAYCAAIDEKYGAFPLPDMVMSAGVITNIPGES